MKHSNILITAIFSGLLLFSCSEYNPDGAYTVKSAESVGASKTVFDENQVRHYHVEISDSAWKWLNDDPTLEQYTAVKVSVDGETIDSVGFRYKGAFGSFRQCFDEDGNRRPACTKFSFKMKFSEYKLDQRFHGLKRLNFHSMMNDATKMHDFLAYRLYRQMGIQAPRSTWATLSINEDTLGVFALVEQIDGVFTDNRWTSRGDGNLYKEVWPRFDKDTNYKLKLKTNEEVADVSAMLRFNKQLQKALKNGSKAEFEKFTNPEKAINYLVTDLAIKNIDGYRTWYCWNYGEEQDCNPHNFYWYEHENRDYFTLIPWDLDGTFEVNSFITGTAEWNDLSQRCDKPYFDDNIRELGHPACDPYFRFLAIHYAQEYKDAIREILNGPYTQEFMESEIDRLVEFLEPYIEQDPTLSVDSWKAATERMKSSIATLRSLMEQRLEGETPVIFGLKSKGVNKFENVNQAQINGLLFSFANSKSRISTAM